MALNKSENIGHDKTRMLVGLYHTGSALCKSMDKQTNGQTGRQISQNHVHQNPRFAFALHARALSKTFLLGDLMLESVFVVVWAEWQKWGGGVVEIMGMERMVE